MNLDDIIFAWKMKYGKTLYANSYRKFIPYGDRFILLCHLIRTLKEQFKYDRDRFDIVVREKIVSACVSEGSPFTQRVHKAKMATKNDLEKALFKIFPLDLTFTEEQAVSPPVENDLGDKEELSQREEV